MELINLTEKDKEKILKNLISKQKNELTQLTKILNKNKNIKQIKQELDKLTKNKTYDLTTSEPVKTKINLNFTLETWYKLQSLITASDKEIGFHALIKRQNSHNFLIYDILVYPQTVTAVTVNVDDVERDKWQQELTDEQFNNMRCQIHSHVNMGVTPSHIDIEQYDEIINLMKNYTDGFYLFMIFNKKWEFFANLYDFSKNAIYHTNDLKIVVKNGNTVLSDWSAQQIKKYVKTNFIPTYQSQLLNRNRPTPQTYYPYQPQFDYNEGDDDIYDRHY